MKSIDTLVVGSGAREHEIARQLDGSDDVHTVYALNGNAGTGRLGKARNRAIQPHEIGRIVSFAYEKNIGLTVIGPEAPLAKGITDRLRAKGLTVFGPSAEAAQLEASKAHATQFKRENRIPHPPATFVHNYEEAFETVASRPDGSYVIKADGLASGKGVFLPESLEEAEQALRNLFINRTLGKAGKEVVLISERYHGPEVSVFVVSDGKRFIILPFAQDYKRLKDGDTGPNTGGMGAYAPLGIGMLSPRQEQKIYGIAERSINGMARRGTPYEGVLYIGIMLAEELGGDPAVIEYNVRFGDPETQVVLPLLSGAGVDVFEMLRSAAEGSLKDIKIPSRLGMHALTVCMAARGYPEKSEKGKVIRGLEEQYEGVIIHHAGTRQSGLEVETAGGRVLSITGVGNSVDQAAEYAYGAIDKITFTGVQYRTDIGYQARTKL